MNNDTLIKLAHWALRIAKGDLDPDSDPFADDDGPDHRGDADDDDDARAADD